MLPRAKILEVVPAFSECRKMRREKRCCGNGVQANEARTSLVKPIYTDIKIVDPILHYVSELPSRNSLLIFDPVSIWKWGNLSDHRRF